MTLRLVSFVCTCLLGEHPTVSDAPAVNSPKTPKVIRSLCLLHEEEIAGV